MLKNIDLNTVFRILLILSGIIYLLPSRLLMGVYSPNYLGWFLILFLIPIVFILFIWLSILDLKRHKINFLIKRLLVLLLVFGLSLGIKYLIK